MQLTDVYSFGLTVWRVLLNCANPFERLPRITTPFNGQNDFVQQMKSNAMFPQVVMQSIEGLHVRFANAVVTATLNLDPAQRSLEAAIYALSSVAATMHHKIEVNNDLQLSGLAQWVLSEDAGTVLGKVSYNRHL